MQKRLILCTLREAYFHFKDQNPGIKIGLSKFIELRPKHVVLPGGSGTHTVCVCVYHQNPKLMIAGSHICSSPEFRKIVDPSWTSEVKVQHLLARLVCNPAKEACWFGECVACKEFASKICWMSSRNSMLKTSLTKPGFVQTEQSCSQSPRRSASFWTHS